MMTPPTPNRARRVSQAKPPNATIPQPTRKKQAGTKRGRDLRDEEAALLLTLALLLGQPVPDHEIKFHPARRWRIDHGWRALKLGIEMEGATFVGGRHTSGKGFEGDCQKYNQAAIMGWCVLRFTRAMCARGEALETILAAYRLREEEAGLVA